MTRRRRVRERTRRNRERRAFGPFRFLARAGARYITTDAYEAWGSRLYLA